MMEDSGLDISRDTRYTELIKQDVYTLIEDYEKINIEFPEDGEK
jgi:hypothetical protein